MSSTSSSSRGSRSTGITSSSTSSASTSGAIRSPRQMRRTRGSSRSGSWATTTSSRPPSRWCEGRRRSGKGRRQSTTNDILVQPSQFRNHLVLAIQRKFRTTPKSTRPHGNEPAELIRPPREDTKAHQEHDNGRSRVHHADYEPGTGWEGRCASRHAETSIPPYRQIPFRFKTSGPRCRETVNAAARLTPTISLSQSRPLHLRGRSEPGSRGTPGSLLAERCGEAGHSQRRANVLCEPHPGHHLWRLRADGRHRVDPSDHDRSGQRDCGRGDYRLGYVRTRDRVCGPLHPGPDVGGSGGPSGPGKRPR